MTVDLLEQSTVNVKNLVIPDIKKALKLPFDLEKDIPQEAIDKVRNKTLAFPQQADQKELFQYQFFCRDLINLAVLTPAILQEIQVGKSFQQRLIDNIQEMSFPTRNAYDLDHVAAMKLMFPSTVIDERTKKLAQTDVADQIGYGRADFHTMQIILNWLIIYPDDKTDPQTFSENWQRYLETHKENLMDYRQSNKPDDVFNFFSIAAVLRMLSPKLKNELRLDQAPWEKAKRILRGQPGDTISCAMAMKLLEAEDIKMTDKGLEIVMPAQATSTSESNLPQVRRF